MAGKVPAPWIGGAPGSSCAVVVWRHRGQLRITVIAKATFALVHEGTMPRVSPQPVLAAEVHHGKVPNRSIRYATDLAPRLDQVGVVLTGHAHVPSGSLSKLTVRLAIFDERRPVLDKHLVVQDAAGFSKMPIVYERAKGGLGQAENPFGREDPNIVDPARPEAPAGFAPMSRMWPARRKLLGKTPRKALDQAIAEIPDDFDFGYFQSAPSDQRCESLRGDEWILLEGLHPSLAVIRSRLPGARAAARIDGLGSFGIPEGTMLPLRLDTVQIDGDEQWCSLVFREALEVPNESAVGAARIVAGVEAEGDGAQDLPDSSSAVRRGPTSVRRKGPSVSSTIELSEDDLRTWDGEGDEVTVALSPKEPSPPPETQRLAKTVALDVDGLDAGVALPFEPLAAPAAPPRAASIPPPAPPRAASIPPPAPPRAASIPPPAPPAPTTPPPAPHLAPVRPSVAPPPPLFPPVTPAAPVAPKRSLDRTITSVDFELPKGALPFDPNAEPALPTEAEPAPAPAAPAPAAPGRVGATTYVLEAEEQESAAEKGALPFISRAPTSLPVRGKRGDEPHIPPRTSEAIPIFTKTAFTACTIPWQIRPGQDVRTVIVKATFDLVADSPVRQRPDPDPPSGDLFEGGDPQKDLRYPSDFAIFKPRADVTLRGHAHPPGGRSSAAEVVFRFGRDRRRFERRIAVFGDRFWQKGLVPTHPEEFEKMPLLHERAYGGPDFVKNPLGRGRAPEPDGRTPLPNLEDRDQLIKTPTSSPRPACCAPLPAFFHDRSSKLGTYGPAWTKTRWPYFPEDFDWAHFQHAPAAQQIDFPAGDEPFDLMGVRPDEPRVSGKLSGAVPRAFAQRTTAAGGQFFEVVLRLDTVAFDTDRMQVDLVWRGLLDVVDDEASDVAEVYVLASKTSGAAIDLERARARYRAERGPWPIVANEPEEPGPANAAQAGASTRPPSPEAPIAAKLRAAGVSVGAAEASSPPPDERPSLVRDDAALRDEVRARLARGATLEGLDLTGADLSGVDFSSQSLAFAVFQGACLRGCRLVASDLSGAVLAGCDLSDAQMERAVLAGADLTGSRLERADLTEVDLAMADLSGVQAEGARFSKARGAHPRFTGADLTRARFDGADIRAVDLTRATLDGAVFDDVKASEIRLYDVRGARASFKRADLTEARADGARLTDSSLALVKAPASVWDGAVLQGSTFLGAALPGAGFARASCERTVLSGADLTDARMARAKLKGALLVRANLMRASLEAADLTGADLRGANLHGAETWKAKLRGAKLDLAIVTQTKLAKERA